MHTSNQVEEKLSHLLQCTDNIKQHRVFAMISSIQHLQIFMQWHVFAVWDFMSLAKRLQSDFTCFSIPWTPPKNNKAARLINEIILGEESDETPFGSYASHFEIYLLAMNEVGASTCTIEEFIHLLHRGNSIDETLLKLEVHPEIRSFVKSTINTACQSETPKVLGNFFYGREDLIPNMFQHLLKNWTVDPQKAPMFVYYLERHIQLDLDSHGPAAKAIISDILHEDSKAWSLMLDAALTAVDRRLKLWDALAEVLEDTRLNVILSL